MEAKETSVGSVILPPLLAGVALCPVRSRLWSLWPEGWIYCCISRPVVEATECWQNGFLLPVLKHGPRSLTYVRVHGWQTLVRNESDSGWTFGAQSAGLNPSGERSECEPLAWNNGIGLIPLLLV